MLSLEIRITQNNSTKKSTFQETKEEKKNISNECKIKTNGIHNCRANSYLLLALNLYAKK